MSQTDKDKWDARYADGAYRDRRHPSALLADWLPRLPRGRALDLACGAGRNALHLARAGYRVDAVDISPVALRQARRAARDAGLDVEWHEADLDEEALPPQRYDLIVVVRYHDPALLTKAATLLRDGGHLLCEQHLLTSREVVGPRNPAFRAAPQALLAAAGELRVLLYREGLMEDPDGRTAALAQLVACRGSPGF